MQVVSPKARAHLFFAVSDVFEGLGDDMACSVERCGAGLHRRERHRAGRVVQELRGIAACCIANSARYFRRAL
ncbi:MAG: hypothetical protein AB7O04_13340 [Hyphomonadaceae bacterium]